MFVKTVVLQICSKFTWEHPCGSVISIKLVRNFTEITLPHFLLYICCIFAKHSFWRTPIGDCFWTCNVIKLVKMILISLWHFTYLNYPLLLKLFFKNWCNYLIFICEISKCWEWISNYNYGKQLFKFIWKLFWFRK